MSETLPKGESVNPPLEEGELLSLEEAVRFLGTSKPTLYRWLAQGELKGLKAGRKWRFRKADLNAFLQRQPIAPTAPADELDSAIARFAEEAIRAGAPEAEARPEADETGRIGVLARQIIALAIARGSSDIHFELIHQEGAAQARVRLRTDGLLHDAGRFSLRLYEALLHGFKQMAAMDVSERKLPQTGRLLSQRDGKAFEIRIATVATVNGEEMVMRLMPAGNELPDLENLGFAPEDVERLLALIHQPNGWLLVTGPAGSGKTTLLYGLLQKVTDDARKTITLEEPVEYMIPGATQIAVNSRGPVTFEVGMRALRRLDPDVILISQIDSLKGIEIACEGAMTGHLVMASMIAPGAAQAICRLLDTGAKPFLIAATLIGVASMRLVRTICAECRTEYSARAGMLARFGFEVEDEEETITLYRGAGCDRCRQTGYRGRTALFELLTLNDALGEAISRSADAEEIELLAQANGMKTLLEDGLRKVTQGVTTPEEVMRVVYGGQ